MLMFDSFSTWRGHEMEHRRQWSCPLCRILCKDEGDIETHILQCHGDTVEPHDIVTWLTASFHPSEFLLASDCPFCDWVNVLRERNNTPKEEQLLVPSGRFLKHLGKHLEEIALFVVPQKDDNPDAFGSEDTVLADNALSSFVSRPSSKVSATFSSVSLLLPLVEHEVDHETLNRPPRASSADSDIDWDALGPISLQRAPSAERKFDWDHYLENFGYHEEEEDRLPTNEPLDVFQPDDPGTSEHN
jgi:hypothetical protein